MFKELINNIGNKISGEKKTTESNLNDRIHQENLIKEIHNQFNPSLNNVTEFAQKNIDKLESEIVLVDLKNNELDNEINNLDLKLEDFKVTIEKSERLNKIGFSSGLKIEKKLSNKLLKEKEELAKKKEKLNENKTNISKTKLINANYIELFKKYSEKYPLYKFITDGMVEDICEKYGLFLGSSEMYISDIPDKNIQEIENFLTAKIDKEDLIYSVHQSSVFGSETISWNYDEVEEYHRRKSNPHYRHYVGLTSYYVKDSNKFFNIVAPLKDFDLTDKVLDGRTIKDIVKDDPIVLKKVVGGYLVVTAWGLEASDPNVMNPKMN